jgi:hypothetical protein
MVVRPVNEHDSRLFDESFANLVETADDLGWNLDHSHLTLDSGFDSEEYHRMIENAGLTPVIKPNFRGTRNQETIHQRLEEFERVEQIYKERCKIERCFAWEDTYRKLVIRYEKLQCTFMGFRYLAYAMINLRGIIGKTHSYSL